MQRRTIPSADTFTVSLHFTLGQSPQEHTMYYVFVDTEESSIEDFVDAAEELLYSEYPDANVFDWQ